MGKKSLPLPSLFKPPPRKHPWHFFPPCAFSPKTLSFRASGDDFFRTVNSVFFDPVDTTRDPWFTTSSESAGSFTTESDVNGGDADESLEMVVRGVRSSTESERLFFHPDDTRSILEQAKATIGFRFKESEVLAMESEDPYGDFRKSMEEMVESHGVRDWEGLDELLGWYLRVNGKNNHGFIVEAFVDLLLSLANSPISASDSTSSTVYYSAISSFSSSSPLCVSQSQGLNEIVDEDDQRDEVKA